MKKATWLFVMLVCSLIFVGEVKAQDINQFATIVNPVRISNYNRTSYESLLSEYDVVKTRNLPTTWLVTFDVLENKAMVNLFKTMDKNQELGIFLEVTNNFAEKSGVIYNDTGFWHHANSVFLSGYTQEERRKLIDKVFEAFNGVFGYYPVSVGSWWTDSYSLSYMKEKYGITANLGCSDQFATDGYKIWGQYWSTPYYSSKYHAGVPATDVSTKLDVVTLQWAHRDPFNGYYSSLYSTQDYQVTEKNLDTEYFEKLVNLYAFKNGNQFGQITVGLESDLSPGAYEGEYSKQLDYIKKLSDQGNIKATNMKDFSSWYRNSFPKLSPQTIYEGTDFLGTGIKYFWYQNPNYRVFYTEDSEGVKTIRDFKIYPRELIDPYFESPNREFSLSIYIPSYYDEVNNKGDVLVLPKETEIIFEDKRILLKTRNLKKADKFVEKNSNGYEVGLEDMPLISKDGVLVRGFSLEAIHFLKQKKAVLYLLKGEGWEYLKKVNYQIPQGELYALEYLSRQEKGNVAVVDKECLQCEYHTQLKHPAFSNLRNYVQKFGKQKIVYSSKITNTDNREKANKEIKDKNIKYIYLIKFEGYKEELLFSPGDLNIEKIFENANAQIWRVI